MTILRRVTNPFLLFCTTVGVISSIALFDRFSVVVSWLDIACFGAVLLAFLFVLGHVFSRLETRGSVRGQALLAGAVAVFVVWNFHLMALDLDAAAQGLLVLVAAVLALATVTGVALMAPARPAIATTLAVGFGLVVGVVPVFMAAGSDAGDQPVHDGSPVAGRFDLDDDIARFIRPVTFTSRPNVYLIGVSAATSEAILRKHLGIDRSPLNDVLRASGFRIFSNSFTEAQPTRESYDLLLSMHRGLKAAIPRDERGDTVSGNVPSALFSLFKANGYTVNTLVESPKFGVGGPHVDHFELAIAPSICNFHFVARDVKPVMYLGACNLRKFLNRFTKLRNADKAAFFADSVRWIEERDEPQLIFVHTRPPHHYTGPKFDDIDVAQLAGFRRRSEGFLRDAAETITRMFAAIRKTDSAAIILVFGDQGLSLSDMPRSGEPSMFHVQDRYAVLAALHPADACAADMPASDRHFVTTAQLVRGIVACLAGGEDPYLAPYEHGIDVEGEVVDPSPYAYE
ncbi:hypothetical protein EJC49_04765 [Aquibium carbonis]|uniref:Sulfatase N-terminal domain-containing protein n=1 Tax=Aquibium carbonis TaxID=2495581 RepID=A0A3R9Y9Z2_9HYPH|nr:sulfatase-like hydrolase/transferase [Aquibium carbonis]RST87540.1 hypothetical protein EJC49_04765 [Aquibium carbonis]